MSLIVMKFGGSSVADKERVINAARLIAAERDKGHDIIVVLSAQGRTTDELIEKAHELNPNPSQREMDMLLSAGEQMSVALMAMCLESMGYGAVSLLGWQAGIATGDSHGCARIKGIGAERIKAGLEGGRIVLVAGFQGVDEHGDITTLGRGGSDTTAVALAAALQADECRIYTDVDGVYDRDPRSCPDAVKLDTVTYDRMLLMAQQGAKVLHDRSVQMAKRYNVKIQVLSSFEEGSGTTVCAEEEQDNR